MTFYVLQGYLVPNIKKIVYNNSIGIYSQNKQWQILQTKT